MFRRVGLQIAVAFLAVTVSSASKAELWITAEFSYPTNRYAHAVLGDDIEYGALVLKAFDLGYTSVVDTFTLPQSRVFEDIAPRPAYLERELGWQFVVVESDKDLGAQLAVYEGIQASGQMRLIKRAATPHIGQRNRWLAPAGIADFDGDGQNDIAYVEIPHLGKILKIVTLKGNELPQIVPPLAGFSNHRIGQGFITSGVRTCEGRTELLTPNADWTALMAVRVENGQMIADQTPFEPSLAGIAEAQRCG